MMFQKDLTVIRLAYKVVGATVLLQVAGDV
jgi:hypothetical protein